jgi:hypothetical protein
LQYTIHWQAAKESTAPNWQQKAPSATEALVTRPERGALFVTKTNIFSMNPPSTVRQLNERGIRDAKIGKCFTWNISQKVYKAFP